REQTGGRRRAPDRWLGGADRRRRSGSRRLPHLHLRSTRAQGHCPATRRGNLRSDGGAASERGYTVLKRAFRDRTVEKTYHALVQGHPDPTEGTIEAPIG